MSHSDIIDREGGPAAFGRPIDVDANTTKAWKRLDSIPAAYWSAIVAAGLASYKELADGAAVRRRKGAISAAAAS